jgi:hypothetical protein
MGGMTIRFRRVRPANDSGVRSVVIYFFVVFFVVLLLVALFFGPHPHFAMLSSC